jgi:ferredoxin
VSQREVSFPGTNHRALRLPERASLSEHLTVQNSPVLFGCRTGICATCLSEVEGDVPPPSADEREVLEVFAPDNPRARLVCQVALTADVRVRVIPQV